MSQVSTATARHSRRPRFEPADERGRHAPSLSQSRRERGVFRLGEEYIAGAWDADRLDEAIYRVLTSKSVRPTLSDRARLKLVTFIQRALNPQSGRRAFNIGVKHYDLGNELFRCMLDETMTYTSAYWPGAATLREAQTAKLDLLCRKLDLQPDDTVLDIGCGWGNFAQHAASRYGVNVTGLTVSREQVEVARNRCRDLPVNIVLKDYRQEQGQYDHVVSIEMIEAVGARNIPVFYETVDRCLKPGGRFALQVISGDIFSRSSDPRMDLLALWLLKYIFPDGYLPSESQLVPPPSTSLRIQDWHRFSDDYERTLLAWAENFNAGWHDLSDSYDDAFRRRWNFYLHACAAAFRAELIHVSQLVYTKGTPGTAQIPVRH